MKHGTSAGLRWLLLGLCLALLCGLTAGAAAETERVLALVPRTGNYVPAAPEKISQLLEKTALSEKTRQRVLDSAAEQGEYAVVEAVLQHTAQGVSLLTVTADGKIAPLTGTALIEGKGEYAFSADAEGESAMKLGLCETEEGLCFYSTVENAALGLRWGCRVVDCDLLIDGQAYHADAQGVCTLAEEADRGQIAARFSAAGYPEGLPAAANPKLFQDDYLKGIAHVWETTEKAAVSCTREGLERLRCTVCGTAGEKAVPAAGHRWGKGVVTKAATCVEKGKKVYTCTACGRTMTEKLKVDPTQHGHLSAVFSRGTCSFPWDVYSTYCTDCGRTVGGGYAVPAAAAHAWDEGKQTLAPTCTAAGVRTYTCALCGGTRTEDIPATGHTEVKDAAVTATCTTAGKTEGSHCSVCNTVIKAQTEVPAKGHTEVKDAAVAATCTAAGKTEGSHCSVCNAVIKAQTEVPATGHTEVKDAAVAATCTAAGKTEGSHCSVCSTVIKAQTEVPATGHTEVKDAAVAATCTAAGKTEGSHCSVCNAVIKAQTEVPATGHTEVKDAAVPATCTAAGKTEGSHCSVCNAVIKAQTEVPATGHQWDAGTPAPDATCTEAGVMAYTCTVCGAKKTEDIPAKGHTEVPDAAVAPTCKKTGLTEGSHCSVCSAVLKAQTVVAVIDHDWQWVEEEESGPIYFNSTATGHYVCSMCGTISYFKPIVIEDDPTNPPINSTTIGQAMPGNGRSAGWVAFPEP